MNAPAPTPSEKISLIHRSLRCLWCGLLGLIPVVGIFFSVRALSLFREVRRDSKTFWNPAERHLKLGAGVAGLGLALCFVWGGVAVELATPDANGQSHCST